MNIYSNTKSALLILLSLKLLTFSAMSYADSDEASSAVSLPLQCRSTPAQSDQLCIIRTDSPYGPYDDVVFYRLDKNGDATLLGSQRGEVATFGGFEFSTGGIFMWLSWAEEGHPHFEFYRTKEFMTDGISANALKVLSDYYFNSFEKFTVTGEVVYTLDDGAYENCDKSGEGASYEIDPKTMEKRCVKKFSLNEL